MGLNSLTPESGPHTDEQPRSARAQELGLDANASWEDINAHTDEQRRSARTQELGLDANASREDINAHTDEQRRKVDDTLSQ